MITYIAGRDLHRHPRLAESMFRDRAAQFSGRLGWPVMVDEDGMERDQYDPLDPIYIVWRLPDGTHGGSMRAMPTEGRTMAAEHFAEICGGVISDPEVWECTRLALKPGVSGKVATALMLGGQVFGHRLGLREAVGIFDAPMERVYRRLGWEPRMLGRTGEGRDAIAAGLWDFDDDILATLSARSGIDVAVAQAWFDIAFAPTAAPAPIAA